MRVPDQPPGDGRLLWEKILKWAAIVFVAVFVLIGIATIGTCERQPTRRQAEATAQADSATREAVEQSIFGE